MNATAGTIVTAEGFTIGTHESLGDRHEFPLLVCLPGGSYSGAYFDIPGHSLLNRADDAGIDAIALDRPNYGASDSLGPHETTFAANADLLDAAITALWDRLGGRYPGVVLIGHSIGGAIAIHIAANPARPWPLAGLSISGIGTVPPEHVGAAWDSMPDGIPVTFQPEQRRAFMYGPDGTFETDVIARASVAAQPVPLEELREVVGGWLTDFPSLAPEVRVPVHYALAEHDGLWVVSESNIAAFTNAFANAATVDGRCHLGVGHNIDHHISSIGWHQEQLDFARSCSGVASVDRLNNGRSGLLRSSSESST